MAVIIGEDGEYAGVKCAKCKKLLVSVFTGLGVPATVISGDDLYKIMRHEAGHKRKKHRKATDRSHRRPLRS